MSSTLDLNGGTVTLTEDDYYTYYQITDTSGSHNGTLVFEPGAILRFDNKSGAGFSATASAIRIVINGSETNNCAIVSGDPNPTYLWTMPASTTTLEAYYTEFMSQTGDTSANYFSFDHCLFAGTRFCSSEELKHISGSAVERIPLGLMVEDATKRTQAKLSQFGLAGSAAISEIKVATLYYALIEMLTRYRLDGTKPSSLSIGGLSMSDSIDTMIDKLEKSAEKLIMQYVRKNSQVSRYQKYMRKVNW